MPATRLTRQPTNVRDDGEPDGSGGGGGSRLAVNINADCVQVLKTYQAREQCSLTEATRRAISALDFLDSVYRAGKSVRVFDPETNETSEVWIVGLTSR